MPIERVAAFIRGESRESFDELALAVLQQHRNESETGPVEIADWRQLSPMPLAALPAKPAERAVDPDLKQAVIDHSFPAACLRGMGRPPVLALVRTGDDSPDPLQASTADRLLEAWAAPDSLALTRSAEVARARSFLGARQRDRRPTLVLAVAASLAGLLQALDRRGLRFRLPPGSRVILLGDPVPPSPEMEGAKPAAAPLLKRLADGLAVPAEAVTHELRVEGLTTRLYTGHNTRGETLPFQPPPWVRLRVLDPATLAEAPAGVAGTLAAFDLAGQGPAAHLLTDTTATAVEGGFHLGGRAAASPG